MSNKNAYMYGARYWCIGVAGQILEKSGQIYAYADRIEIEQGALVLVSESRFNMATSKYETTERTNLLAIAPGQWLYFFAAAGVDGHAVAAEHWPGEIAE